jgi:hypothetical protein
MPPLQQIVSGNLYQQEGKNTSSLIGGPEKCKLGRSGGRMEEEQDSRLL